MGAIADRLKFTSAGTTAAELAYVKNFLKANHTTQDDVTIQGIIDDALAEADGVCHNPFTRLVLEITVTGAEVANMVSVHGITWELAEAADLEEHEIAIGASDELTAQAILDALTDTTYGMRNISGTRSGTTITLDWLVDQGEPIPAAEISEDELAVTYRQTTLDIPKDVGRWVLMLIERWYRQRGLGLRAESDKHLGSEQWDPIDYTPLAKHIKVIM